MRQIDLRPYKVEAEPGQPEEQQDAFDVRISIVEITYSRGGGVPAAELLKRDDLARKIRDWPNDTLLLEDAEYDLVVQSVNAYQGFQKPHVEFIRRVLEAPTVDLAGTAGSAGVFPPK